MGDEKINKSDYPKGHFHNPLTAEDQLNEEPNIPEVNPLFDWGHARKNAFSKARAPHWPEKVRAISMNGLTLLGLDPEYKLYWDGRPVEIKRPLSLSFWQKVGAIITVLSALIVAGAAVTSTALDLLTYLNQNTDTQKTSGPISETTQPTKK